jgi:effector-binding domain-containing protein
MVSAVMKTGLNNRHKEFLFTIRPDTIQMGKTWVVLSYRNTVFKEWFGKGELVKNAIQSLGNLKDYMEDPQQLYGYDIRIVNVTDTAFLFKSVTVPVGQKREATRNLFEELINFAEKKKAGYTGVRIFYSQKSGDEITLFASIGVSTSVAIDSTESFEYKLMPFGKRLLEATYQGPYGEVGKVYNALATFKTDHNLTSMAIPFQKFLNNGYDFSDEQIVQMKIYYPIF